MSVSCLPFVKCEVNPLESFDTPIGHTTPPPAKRRGHGHWVVAKRLAGHTDKLQWPRAVKAIHDPDAATAGELRAMKAVFSDGDWMDWFAVMTDSQATPYKFAKLFHIAGVDHFMAVGWINQFSNVANELSELAVEIQIDRMMTIDAMERARTASLSGEVRCL